MYRFAIVVLSLTLCHSGFCEVTTSPEETEISEATVTCSEPPTAIEVQSLAHTAAICSPMTMALGASAMQRWTPSASAAIARVLGPLSGRLAMGLNIVGGTFAAVEILGLLARGANGIEQCRTQEIDFKRHIIEQMNERGEQFRVALEGAGFTLTDQQLRQLRYPDAYLEPERLNNILCADIVNMAIAVERRQNRVYLDITSGTMVSVPLPPPLSRQLTETDQTLLQEFSEGLRCLDGEDYLRGVCAVGAFVAFGRPLPENPRSSRPSNAGRDDVRPQERVAPNQGSFHNNIRWGQVPLTEAQRSRILQTNRTAYLATQRSGGDSVDTLRRIYSDTEVIPPNGVVHILGPGGSVEDWAIPLMARSDTRLILTEGTPFSDHLRLNLLNDTEMRRVYGQLNQRYPQLIRESHIRTSDQFIAAIRQRITLNTGFENRRFHDNPSGVIRGWVQGDELPQADFLYANQVNIFAASGQPLNGRNGGDAAIYQMFQNQMSNNGVMLVTLENIELRLGRYFTQHPSIPISPRLVQTGSTDGVVFSDFSGAGMGAQYNRQGFFIFP